MFCRCSMMFFVEQEVVCSLCGDVIDMDVSSTISSPGNADSVSIAHATCFIHRLVKEKHLGIDDKLDATDRVLTHDQLEVRIARHWNSTSFIFN